MKEDRKFSLVGVDGNAYSVMGYVVGAMKTCKKSEDEIKAYTTKAMGGDYYNLLAVSADMIDQLNEISEN